MFPFISQSLRGSTFGHTFLLVWLKSRWSHVSMNEHSFVTAPEEEISSKGHWHAMPSSKRGVGVGCVHLLGGDVDDGWWSRRKTKSYPLVNSQMHMEWKAQVCLPKGLHKWVTQWDLARCLEAAEVTKLMTQKISWGGWGGVPPIASRSLTETHHGPLCATSWFFLLCLEVPQQLMGVICSTSCYFWSLAFLSHGFLLSKSAWLNWKLPRIFFFRNHICASRVYICHPHPRSSHFLRTAGPVTWQPSVYLHPFFF